VQRIEKKAEKLVVGTRGNGRIEADVVVAGIGIEPNVDLAKAAGLDVRSGIIVDEMLRTSHPHIFAAGDVANFPCRVLRERFRFEHEDNADAMGRAAGRNMAGASEVLSICPSSIRICLICAMRPLAASIAAWRLSRIGSKNFTRA
jgi:3-phenylpropionate/trans-cinnamate dioxygenase ferredoxin reductase component